MHDAVRATSRGTVVDRVGRPPVVAAELQNTAGIVGAAMAAEFNVTATGK